MNRHWLARCHHQGLDTQLLQRSPPPVRSDADVQRRGRLGGLLSFYYREAASVVGPLLAPYAFVPERLILPDRPDRTVVEARLRRRVPSTMRARGPHCADLTTCQDANG